MPWIYENRTKRFYHDSLKKEWKAYSGKKGFVNNSAFQCVKFTGPIPTGRYRIGKHKKHNIGWGMRLTPIGINNKEMVKICGRDNFLIHGDNTKGNESASKGCIILNKKERLEIVKSGDSILIVKGPALADLIGI